MAFNTVILIWLFPIVFILHDLEELLLFEPWLKKNAGSIMARVRDKVPAFLEKQLATILKKSTWQLTIPVGLIFILTCIASFVAAQHGQYSFFLLAGSLFFMHGFLHIGQAIIMRKYIPALVTSLFIVIPYGIGLFWNLLDARIINITGLLSYFIIGAIIAIPFILIMHAIGAALYNGIKKQAL